MEIFWKSIWSFKHFQYPPKSQRITDQQYKLTCHFKFWSTCCTDQSIYFNDILYKIFNFNLKTTTTQDKGLWQLQIIYHLTQTNESIDSMCICVWFPVHQQMVLRLKRQIKKKPESSCEAPGDTRWCCYFTSMSLLTRAFGRTVSQCEMFPSVNNGHLLPVRQTT